MEAARGDPKLGNLELQVLANTVAQAEVGGLPRVRPTSPMRNKQNRQKKQKQKNVFLPSSGTHSLNR